MKRERSSRFAKLTALLSLFALAPVQAQKPASAVAAVLPINEAAPTVDATTERPSRDIQLQALMLPSISKLSLIDKAYLDVFTILKDDNSCSRFFGGPAAIEVLNRLAKQLTPRHFENNIALRMKGVTMMAQNYSTRLSYRLFEKAELNLDGPFYKTVASRAEPVPGVGLFQPNTREARVTILLHELGHLIRDSNQTWLLPDDGDSIARSQENTDRVIAVCSNQINQLEHLSFDQEFLFARGTSLHLTVSGELAIH